MHSCIHYGAQSITLTTTYRKEKFYPQFQQDLNATVLNKNSIMVTANMTKAGIMYCKAFEIGTTPSSYSSVKTGGYVSYSSIDEHAENASVVIKNLSPDTTYNVYCGTEDYENRIMETADVIGSRQQVTTTCCRKINIVQAIDQQIVYILAV